MYSNPNDKLVERMRYDAKASRLSANSSMVVDIGSIPIFFRPPYNFYYECIRNFSSPDQLAMEVGSGTGMNSLPLMKASKYVTLTDISPRSVAFLKAKFENEYPLAKFVVQDMESFSFKSGVFDLVVSAGCLSYGDNDVVRSEIFRILKPGGFFICVDSLNHNPIYRINRYLNYLRGLRSYSTLKRMPTLNSIGNYTKNFECIELKFFGSISFLGKILAWMFNENFSMTIVDSFDRLVNCRRSAFKFVAVFKKPIMEK